MAKARTGCSAGSPIADLIFTFFVSKRLRSAMKAIVDQGLADIFVTKTRLEEE